MKQRTYSIGLGISFLLVWLVVSYYVWTTPPFAGDMTRLGGYSEYEFAPRAPISTFTKHRWTRAETLYEYDRYYDVVVVGDSFSQNADYGWQSYLEESTGWSIITFHAGKISVPELLQSATFRQHPPKLFVYEIVEHGFHTFEPGIEVTEEPHARPEIRTTLTLSPQLHPKAERTQDLSPRLSMSDGVHRLQRDIKRLIGSRDKAFRCDLSEEHFFSNANASEIIYYHGDTWKNDIPLAHWPVLADRVRALRRAVEANGVTRFVFMLAPDKSTIYAPYIVNPPKPILSALELVPDWEGIPRLPLHERLSEDIQDETIQDVYLPNDAHWGNAGYRLAAEHLLEYLQEQNAISTP